jgi:hypothetical protein
VIADLDVHPIHEVLTTVVRYRTTVDIAFSCAQSKEQA